MSASTRRQRFAALVSPIIYKNVTKATAEIYIKKLGSLVSGPDVPADLVKKRGKLLYAQLSKEQLSTINFPQHFGSKTVEKFQAQKAAEIAKLEAFGVLKLMSKL